MLIVVELLSLLPQLQLAASGIVISCEQNWNFGTQRAVEQKLGWAVFTAVDWCIAVLQESNRNVLSVFNCLAHQLLDGVNEAFDLAIGSRIPGTRRNDLESPFLGKLMHGRAAGRIVVRDVSRMPCREMSLRCWIT